MMRRRAILLTIGFLLALDATAWAQLPAVVRVVEQAPVRRWLNPAGGDVLMTVEPGTLLEVLDRDGEAYWVITPRDVHGARRSGWVAAGLVEAVAAPEEPVAAAAADAAPEVTAPEAGEAIAETPVPPDPPVRAMPKQYEFADVLFDRDRYALRPEAVSVLRGAVSALKEDTLLRLTIEGHTCNLGTPAYNRDLGHRRAIAVRDFLVAQGVAAERLHTVSVGAEHPAHDNSQEATRALNRRVVLILRDR